MNLDRLTIDELTVRAEQMEEVGMFDEAFELWSVAVKRSPDPILLCQFGNSAMELGKWIEAEQAFLSALELAPEIPNAYNYLGLLFLEQGKPDRAQDFFKNSLSIDETARTFTLLGVTQLDLGRTREAMESFRNALTIDTNYQEAYYNLAVTLRYENPTDAISLFQKALELDSEYAIAHRELGWTLRIIDKYPEAAYHLRRAIELIGSDGWAYIYLGNLMWAIGDLISAEQAFENAIATWPDISLPYWCLAHFFEHQERTQEAEILYKKALQLDPDDIEGNLRFGVYLKDIGEYTKAKVYLGHALSLDPNNKRIRDLNIQ